MHLTIMFKSLKKMTCNLQFLIQVVLLFPIIYLSLCVQGLSFDNTKIYFSGDSTTTFCRELTGGPDLYYDSLFSRLKASPPPGFTIEPFQDILSKEPCSSSHPEVSGYGGLKILDWNTECTDAFDNGMCGWSCNDCPVPECEIHRSTLLFGGEADWCCCASRRSCIDQSDAQYVILALLANDLIQLFKFYGSDTDLVIEEAKSLTNYITDQGRTVIWLTFYPLGNGGSLGNGNSACSDVFSCLFSANSNSEYFYEQFDPWITNQPDVYQIDFFEYIKATYPLDPMTFITIYGYDSIHLNPGGHEIYFDFVYPQLTSILAEIDDPDGDGISGSGDNCPNHFNPNQEDTFPPQGNGCGDACECEGNFDDDDDQDGTDAFTFKADFGRSTFLNPCNSDNPCNGNFDCDGDVDGTDAGNFKIDFGRSNFNNPCPACEVGDWCVSPQNLK